MIDLRDSVEQLDGVIASIDKLPLIQDQRLQQSEPESVIVPVSQSEDTMMNKVRSIIAGLADELWQSIRGMVRVQRLDRAESALIAPEQRVCLQQGLRLVLLDARHSLVMRNTATYQQNLSQARAWIEKYCDVSNVLVKTDLARLQSLSELNIDPTVVSLEATRIALMAARAALLGEPLSISETSAANDAKPVNEAKPNGASE